MIRLLALAALTLPVAASAGKYTPLWDTADYGVYTCGPFGGDVVVTADHQVPPSGRHYTNFSGFGPMWTWAPESTDKTWVYSGGQWQVLANFGAQAGSSWRIDIDPCNHGTSTLRGSGYTVSTAAGSFDDVAILEFDQGQTICADAGLTSASYAPGIGPIAWTYTTIAGPVTCELSRASIGGQSYPERWGFQVAGTFETTEAWINMMPPGPHPPKEVEAKISVTNDTDYPLTFQFNSGQRFDILVIDDAGNVVSSWSRGKAFTLAIAILNLEPGESWSYSGVVELTDDNGDHLDPGAYTLRVELSSDGAQGTDQLPGSESPSSESPLFIGYAF